MSGKSTGSRSGHAASNGSTTTTTTSNGFYKRLLEWLSRKKKSHRRYSEVVLPTEHCPVDPHCKESLHGLMAVASAGRNQSAPMIFDVSRPIRSATAVGNFSHVPVLYGHSPDRIRSPRIEESSSVEEAQDGGKNGTKKESSSSSTWSSSTSSTSSLSSSSSLSSAPQPPVLLINDTHNRLGVDIGPEAPPTTPTSSYSQSGIIQFEKQESEEKGQEIDAEWIIPWSDIQVGQVISRRGTCTINRYVRQIDCHKVWSNYNLSLTLIRGKWHGDVIIHRFELQNSIEVNAFWSDVQSLSKLRHENLLLFMGIATQSSSYTIVNSAPRGVSVANFRLGLKNGKPERIG